MSMKNELIKAYKQTTIQLAGKWFSNGASLERGF